MTDLLENFDKFERENAEPEVPPAGEKEEFSEDGNNATAELVTPTPKTLEEILEACKVDLTTWKVDHWVANKWDQGSKIGSGKSAFVRVTPLYQIKVWLVRIRMEAIQFPEVQPVHFSLPEPQGMTQGGHQRGLKRAVIIPDIQCGFKRNHRTGHLTPFHDRRAMNIAWAITQHVQPDRIVLLGDNLDLPEFSDKFIKSPEFYFTTQAAVAELAWWLAQMRQGSPDAQIDYIEGNHDFRFLKTTINHNVASYDLRAADDLEGPALLSIERLLGLQGLNIQYHGPYPTGEVWLNDNLRFHHGDKVRSKSGQTVKVVAEDLRHSEGQGHIHRIEMASKTVWGRKGPKIYVAFSPGTLASIDPGIVPAAGYRQNWQQGLAVVEYEEGNGYFNIYPLHIYRDICLYDNIKWVAQSEAQIVENIQRSLGDRISVQ